MPSPWTQSIGHELIQITNVGRELFDGKFISVLKLHLRGNTSTTSCMNCVKGLLHSRLGMQSLVQEAAKRIVHWLHCFFHFPWNNLKYQTTNHLAPSYLPISEKQVISAAAESNRQVSHPPGGILDFQEISPIGLTLSC
jgi:hypothetical protein